MNTSGKRQVKAEAQNANRHAVVLGGSLAGLLTARILSDHFEHVTLIERDAYFDTTETRRGIPQANHVHGLLAAKSSNPRLTLKLATEREAS